MRLLSLFLLLILLSACQEQGPNKLEQYQQAKIKDTQKLEEKFNTAIAKIAEEERQLMVAHSPEGKEVLKSAIEAYSEQNTTSLTPNVDEDLLGAIDTAIRQRDELGIVKNGAILMKVRDYQETYDMIQKLTTELEADIIAETQTTTDYNQENTLQLQVNPTQFNKIMDLLGSTATIIRKKQVWQPMAKEEYAPIVSSLEAQAIRQKALVRQFKPTLAVSDKMLLQENLASTNQVINNQLSQAVRLAKDLPESQITVSIFQPIDFVKPAPEPFNASFSANLELGWENFKVFLLQAATVWPYVLIGTIFLLTVLLATASSKRKARKFRLQTLQAQQQQIAATVAKSTTK